MTSEHDLPSSSSEIRVASREAEKSEEIERDSVSKYYTHNFTCEWGGFFSNKQTNEQTKQNKKKQLSSFSWPSGKDSTLRRAKKIQLENIKVLHKEA